MSPTPSWLIRQHAASTFIQPPSSSQTSKSLLDVGPKPQSHVPQAVRVVSGGKCLGPEHRDEGDGGGGGGIGRLMDVWLLLAGSEVVSGASQGFSDVEETGSIHVSSDPPAESKAAPHPRRPPQPKISAGTTLSPRTLQSPSPHFGEQEQKSRAWIPDLMQHELIPKAFLRGKFQAHVTQILLQPEQHRQETFSSRRSKGFIKLNGMKPSWASSRPSRFLKTGFIRLFLIRLS